MQCSCEGSFCSHRIFVCLRHLARRQAFTSFFILLILSLSLLADEPDFSLSLNLVSFRIIRIILFLLSSRLISALSSSIVYRQSWQLQATRPS